jgi:Asp-tRNA(Asn)/Glu-tRNA(Gln) amidotransferase A subunit family amidase
MVAGVELELDDAQQERLLAGTVHQRGAFRRGREESLGATPPALVFDPTRLVVVHPSVLEVGGTVPAALVADRASVDLAWADIRTLAALVRSGAVTCVELARLALERLRAVDAVLHCVVTFLDDEALLRAAALDAELAAGRWRGLLHGIPWGAKDILAHPGAPTTWGAEPYLDQHIDEDATVIARLTEAGANLVAKLTTGELAMGDEHAGGRTMNPWAPGRGSSGSSAGPASATAAGAVTFAIGSETIGSIVSPSAECGCSSLRPTYGRVSRHGAMALSWSFDKLGPMCRSLDDAALVFDVIRGPDGRDPTVFDLPFRLDGHVDVRGWRVGLVAGPEEDEALPPGVEDELMALGVELVPVAVPTFDRWTAIIAAMAEQGAAFDELTRSPDIARLTAHGDEAWPDVFRASRLLPAVEYLQAQRRRAQLVVSMEEALAGVDALVHTLHAKGLVVLCNLTGHPAAIAPGPVQEDGTLTSVTFTGRIAGEARLLALAAAWQRSTRHHLVHPTV